MTYQPGRARVEFAATVAVLLFPVPAALADPLQPLLRVAGTAFGVFILIAAVASAFPRGFS